MFVRLPWKKVSHCLAALAVIHAVHSTSGVDRKLKDRITELEHFPVAETQQCYSLTGTCTDTSGNHSIAGLSCKELSGQHCPPTHRPGVTDDWQGVGQPCNTEINDTMTGDSRHLPYWHVWQLNCCSSWLASMLFQSDYVRVSQSGGAAQFAYRAHTAHLSHSRHLLSSIFVYLFGLIFSLYFLHAVWFDACAPWLSR